MLEYDFENSLGYWVFITAHAMALAMNEELQTHGITRRQSEVLGWISVSGNLSQSELAERMGIEAPTLVGVLDRMERDGWIQRVPSDKDRRKKLIRPTAKVEPVWAQMIESAMRVRARATEGLTEDQVRTLRESLRIVYRNLSPETPADIASDATA